MYIIGGLLALSCGGTYHAEPCRRPKTRGLPAGQARIHRQTSAIKQAVAQYRRDIARLKRQLREQAKEIAFLKAQERTRLRQPSAEAEEAAGNVPLLAALREGPTAPLTALGRRLRQVGGRVGADDLPLGARPGTAAKGAAGRHGGDSRTWPPRGAGETGPAEGRRKKDQATGPRGRGQEGLAVVNAPGRATRIIHRVPRLCQPC